ncbi:MAG: ATP synthase F1 subunit epsilon [Gloeomargarita sp. SKYBB_i_bin120]|nr:ATP synthase F1 subunit epsilon [Gloeomargarita sp. SKYG98]MCS7291996.1 ATP synthase F1 subunit epsilon [Gloeomargarita sp. SKYB120]MDW8177556.1 ATP synthase F1 subunit epsilon [Gloeomargarita sp. SKYBB_i_bin120]
MTLTVRVITPDQTVWDGPAQEVILPSMSGQLGILTDHIPLLTALDIGVMQIKAGGTWTPLVVLGGFAEVENNEVTVLVNGAERGDSLKLEQVQQELAAAEAAYEQATTRKDKLDATQQLKQAKARLQAVRMVTPER